MMHVRRILFPIAFSEAVAAMAPSVREMAEHFNAAVTVLHAVNLAPEYFPGPAPDTPCESSVSITFSPALQELRSQQERRLEAFAVAHFSGIDHAQRIEDGDPATVIEWVAKCENTDLIVMPTKGLGRFRRLLMGSVTTKVLHDIACPVWTNVHRPDPTATLFSGYRSILCAVGIGSGEEHVFDAASLFARAYGAKVCLLRIQPPGDERERQSVADALRRSFKLACTATGKDVAIDTSVRVLDGDLVEGIRRILREEVAGLLIVGRGHAMESFSRAWSHLYTIIRESSCPVLSV